METVELHLTNNLAELDRLNALVAGFGERVNFTATEEYSIYLIIEEIFTNIVNHAWSDPGEHSIFFRLSASKETAKMEFHDDGQPFDPTEADTPDIHASVEDRPIGGLGLHLVREAASEMFYQRLEEQNQLIVIMNRGQQELKS